MDNEWPSAFFCNDYLLLPNGGHITCHKVIGHQGQHEGEVNDAGNSEYVWGEE